MRRLSLVMSLCLALSALAGCAECDLAEELESLAGGGATDCGFVPLGESRVEAHGCMVSAFRQGRGFFVRFEEQGIDSRVERGTAGNAEGRVFFLTYDGDPSGGGGDADPVVWRTECLEPRVETVAEGSVRSDGLEPGAELLGCADTTQSRTICD